MTDIERTMTAMQSTLSSTSVTIDQYREAIFLSATEDPLLSAVPVFFFDCSCTNCNFRSADSQSIQCLLVQNVEHLLLASYYDEIFRL